MAGQHVRDGFYLVGDAGFADLCEARDEASTGSDPYGQPSWPRDSAKYEFVENEQESVSG